MFLNIFQNIAVSHFIALCYILIVVSFSSMMIIFEMIYFIWLTVKEGKSNVKCIGLPHFDLTYLSVRPEMKGTSG